MTLDDFEAIRDRMNAASKAMYEAGMNGDIPHGVYEEAREAGAAYMAAARNFFSIVRDESLPRVHCSGDVLRRGMNA